jgi:hypothetical protein
VSISLTPSAYVELIAEHPSSIILSRNANTSTTTCSKSILLDTLLEDVELVDIKEVTVVVPRRLSHYRYV